MHRECVELHIAVDDYRRDGHAEQSQLYVIHGTSREQTSATCHRVKICLGDFVVCDVRDGFGFGGTVHGDDRCRWRNPPESLNKIREHGSTTCHNGVNLRECR